MQHWLSDSDPGSSIVLVFWSFLQHWLTNSDPGSSIGLLFLIPVAGWREMVLPGRSSAVLPMAARETPAGHRRALQEQDWLGKLNWPKDTHLTVRQVSSFTGCLYSTKQVILLVIKHKQSIWIQISKTECLPYTVTLPFTKWYYVAEESLYGWLPVWPVVWIWPNKKIFWTAVMIYDELGLCLLTFCCFNPTEFFSFYSVKFLEKNENLRKRG